MPKKPAYMYVQSAVVPYRAMGDTVELLLITSLRKRRWMVPKGVVEPGMTPHESAGQEAYEEAGVRGRVASEPLGQYRVHKWGGVCTVDVFPMEVTEVLSTWPEAEVRERRWVSVEEAAALIHHPDLRRIVQRLKAR